MSSAGKGVDHAPEDWCQLIAGSLTMIMRCVAALNAWGCSYIWHTCMHFVQDIYSEGRYLIMELLV